MTGVATQFLGLDDRMDTIAVGRDTYLVILDADLRNTRRINTVVLRGRFLTRHDRTRMLDRIRSQR